MGYYGAACSLVSPVRERVAANLVGYQTAQLTDGFTLAWRSLEAEKQMEMVMR
jgi:hypothetical protein